MFATLQDAKSKLSDAAIVELVNWAIEEKAKRTQRSKEYSAKCRQAMKVVAAAQRDPQLASQLGLATRVAIS